jgi:hypothetical protein
MRLLLSILTNIIVATSCSSGSHANIVGESKLDTLSIPSDSTAFYFLSKKSNQDTTNNSLDSFVNTWYSQMLYFLKEPILYSYKGDKEIYRFTWLRSFHHPVIVRIEKQSNIIRLFAKVSNGAGGFEPGKIIVDTTFDVAVKEWDDLKKKIVEVKFWEIPTESKKHNGKDGSEWIIEGIKDNMYHMAIRWTPNKIEEGNFRSIGETLISISKIKDETKDYY